VPLALALALLRLHRLPIDDDQVVDYRCSGEGPRFMARNRSLHGRWDHETIWLDCLAVNGDSSVTWNFADAKNRLSEVVNLALTEGPQTITRRSDTVVLISATSLFRSRPGPQAVLR
jgi:prevent-host-death family protein